LPDHAKRPARLDADITDRDIKNAREPPFLRAEQSVTA
jgi:hypothetical protein